MSVALGGCLKAPPVAFGLTEDTGGHITYVLGAAIALAKRDDVDAVEVVTRLIDDPALGAAYAVPHEEVAAKLHIRRIATGDQRYLAKEAAIADRPAFLAALIAHIERSKRKPDLLHAHFADAGAIALAIRERFGIPFIYSAHSLGIDKARAGGRDGDGHDLSARVAEEGRIIAAADAIVASSRDEAERQLMLYPAACASRIHRIAPGASLAAIVEEDVAAARKLIAPFLRDPDKPMILAIARPVAKKNLAGLVDLYAADPELRTRANLVIVAGLRDGPLCGEPEQRQVIGGLLERLDRHDLYGSFALPKRHSQAEIGALYALARETGGVFVNPAFTEPYGLTLAEAAVHGLPVVATCHGGAPDIVAQLGHGLVADPRDRKAFAQAIGSLLNDRAQWKDASRQGRRNAAGMDWDSYAARFLAVATSLTRKAPAAVTDINPSRLLLCDIDNTVTGCRPGASELTRYLAVTPTLAFGVATGRSLQEAERLLEEWKLPAPRVLVTSVGAEIYWRDGERLVPDLAYRDYIDHGWDAAAVEARVATIRGIELQPPVEQRRHKRSWFVEDSAVVAAVRAAVADLPVRVIHSHDRLLDILPERAGKGAAMVWVARRLGISRDRVYAAGDSGNDLDMLTACNNAILVANHSEELAALPCSPTTYRARRSHAGGIVEGMHVYECRAAA